MVAVSRNTYDALGELGHSTRSVEVADFDFSDRVSRLIQNTQEAELNAQATELAENIGTRLGTNENYEDGDCILFHRNFSYPGSDKPDYFYVALKAGGLWFVTGRSKQGYRITWNELMRDFLVPAFVETGQVWVATEWAKL